MLGQPRQPPLLLSDSIKTAEIYTSGTNLSFQLFILYNNSAVWEPNAELPDDVAFSNFTSAPRGHLESA